MDSHRLHWNKFTSSFDKVNYFLEEENVLIKIYLEVTKIFQLFSMVLLEKLT